MRRTTIETTEEMIVLINQIRYLKYKGLKNNKEILDELITTHPSVIEFQNQLKKCSIK